MDPRQQPVQHLKPIIDFNISPYTIALSGIDSNGLATSEMVDITDANGIFYSANAYSTLTTSRDSQMNTNQLSSIMAGYSYPLIFASVVGSHAFGYATDLSDYDIHGVHLLSLNHVLGLSATTHETIEIKVTHHDPVIDIVTHDLKKFIFLLLKGNGNVLEDLYSPLIIRSSPAHEELKVLGKGCISKMCANHYKGMAYNQQRRMQLNDVKKLLHCYRCLLMGIHLMRSGELMMDLATLAREYNYPQVQGIIYDKQSGIEGMDNEEMSVNTAIIEGLYSRLDVEAEQSQLPDKTPQAIRNELEQLLIRVRIEVK